MARTGRPIKSRETRRNFYVSLAFTEMEKKRIIADWKHSGVSNLAEYCRLKLLDVFKFEHIPLSKIKN